ncbi:hypothetical protein [Nonomuraea sp. NPDC002799]
MTGGPPVPAYQEFGPAQREPGPAYREHGPAHQVAEPPRRLTRAWRPAVLVGLPAAVLVAALTWWIMAPGPSTPSRASRTDQNAPAVAVPTGTPTPTATQAAGETTPSPADAAGQAAKMNDLLTRSSATRANLSHAITGAGRCDRDGVDTIRDVTASRRAQLAAARTLAVTALPGGAELKDALVDALHSSYEADAAFLAWARRHVRGGCTASIQDDRDHRRGLARSEAAQRAKTRFAREWRSLADAYDLTAWKASQI